MNLACSLEITKVIIYSIWCFFIFCVKWIFELRFIWRTWSMNRAYGRRWCRGWFKRNTNPLEVLRLFFQWYIVESLFEEARLRTTISFLRSTKKNGIFVSDFRFSDHVFVRFNKISTHYFLHSSTEVQWSLPLWDYNQLKNLFGSVVPSLLLSSFYLDIFQIVKE